MFGHLHLFKPEAVDPTAWYMFAIFVATIIACITQPMSIGAVSIIGFTVMVLVGIIDMKTAVAGFGNNSIWLIAMAFFISRGFVKTGLGRRIALHFVKLFGKNIRFSLFYRRGGLNFSTCYT